MTLRDDWAGVLRRLAFPGAICVLLAFSFAWVWIVGHRGLFVFDHSIAFDGAWRIAQGQVPYRDFWMPFGPMTFVLTGSMFRWLGVDFSVLVLTAALLSLLATALSMRLVWIVTSRSLGAALLAGSMTAIWYQAPFGLPWMEQTAFGLDLLSLVLIAEGRERRASSMAWHVFAGVAAAGAILSKQNAGGLFVGVSLGAIALPYRERRREVLRGIAGYGAGLGTSAAAFACWLVTMSDPASFFHYWVELAAHIGAARLDIWGLVGTLFFQRLAGSALPLFWLTSLVGGATLWLVSQRPEPVQDAPRVVLAAWCTLALPLFHSVLQLTINNEPVNNNAFAGICAGCTWSLLARASRAGSSIVGRDGSHLLPARPLRFALGGLAVLSAYSVIEGGVVAYQRTLHDFVGASFERRLEQPAASRLKWGEPTRVAPAFCSLVGDSCATSPDALARDPTHAVLRRRDFEALAAELRRRRQNFFVFPDATILYGLTGRPSPQPLLYFHPEQSFSRADQPDLDRAIVASLQRNHVRLVVLERSTFMGTHRLLPSFVCLNRWIVENFEPVAEYGNYRLLAASPKGATTGFALPAGCERPDRATDPGRVATNHDAGRREAHDR